MLTVLGGLFHDVFCYGFYFLSGVYFKIKPFIKGKRKQYTNLFEFSLTECIWSWWIEMVVQKTEKHQPIFQSIVKPKIVTLEFLLLNSDKGFPGGTSGKEPACQCRRHKRCRFNPWVGKIPWSRKWQPTPVFLPGKSHGQRSLAGYSP